MFAKMQSMNRCLVVSLLVFNALLARSEDTLSDLARRTSLTSSDSRPFHLQGKIVETTNPESGYQGEIDEYWISPSKWRRSVQSPDFSQTVIQNGDKYVEENRGAYYPIWLRTLVDSVVDPARMLGTLRQSDLGRFGTTGKIATMCKRLEERVGASSAQNTVFSNFCFTDSPAILESALTPGHGVQFKDYKSFEGKMIARHLVSTPESGTTIEAKITKLTPLGDVDESLFNVPQSTPLTGQIRTIQISGEKAQQMYADAPSIVWPTTRGGKISGVLSVYASADRTGQVREVWPLNSDNPNLDDSVREQVMKWKFKPAVNNGAPVQIETILTFPFQTKLENAYHILDDSEARKLAIRMVEPNLSSNPSGKEFTVRVFVDPDGKVGNVQNVNGLPTPEFLRCYGAARMWVFRPYMQAGKPDNFEADITFRVP